MTDEPRRLALPLLVVVGLASSVAAGWLYLENTTLRQELSESQQQDAVADTTNRASVAETSLDGETTVRKGPRADSLFAGLARASREQPALSETDSETREQRRLRRRDEIRAFLGRGDDESIDEYRQRLVPLIEGGLMVPRTRMAELRTELEEAAEVSDDQREQLDQLFADASQEALELTNAAIASGDLTPYDTNWSGALSFAGGLGSILDGAEGQIGSILTPEQMALFRDRGFVWGEYIGVNVPWEQLYPPPRR